MRSTSPLTGIATRASAARRWLAAERPDIEKARAALEQIEAAGHRAGDIIASVKSMFKKDTQEKSPVDINKLIWTVLGLVDIDLRKHQIELRNGTRRSEFRLCSAIKSSCNKSF